MGMTHNNTATFPRLADVLGFVPVSADGGDAALLAVAEAIVKTQVCRKRPLPCGGCSDRHCGVCCASSHSESMGCRRGCHPTLLPPARLSRQRDHGDRSNRKHARFKYTVDDHGVQWVRDQVFARCGIRVEPARPFKFLSNGDSYGWRKSAVDGTFSYTLFIQVREAAAKLHAVQLCGCWLLDSSCGLLLLRAERPH
jgi:hypothetical protein